MSAAPVPHRRTKVRGGNRLLLHGVPWGTYVRLLKLFAHRHLRLTYDRGALEIMTISHEHATYGYFLGRLVDELTMEMGLPVKSGANTTFKRRKKEKGLEPDNCYWIVHESLLRGKKVIDLRVDPPPDLSLEIDITHSSLNRLSIYAALKVPEVWRYDGQSLTFYALQADGRYQTVSHSKQFPFLRPEDLLSFLLKKATMEENALIREFRAWLRTQKPET